MSGDMCEVKILNGVTIQENGIIRSPDGYIIARLNKEIPFDSRHLINTQEPKYTYSAEVIKVVDGDTLDLQIDLGFNIKHTLRIRLSNIDAYETTLRGKTSAEEKEKGIEGKQYLIDTILNKKVVVKTNQLKGSFGRYLAEIYLDDLSINELMVEKGYAVIMK